MMILAPVPTNRRSLRFVQLFGGLILYGVSDGLLVRANLGLDPWDVFHQGLSRTFGLEIGTWSIIVGAFVLLLWIPLHQRPGVGTVCNIVIVGLVLNVTVNEIPAPKVLVVRVVVMAAGVVLNGIATGAYIGAELGPGPRDGLTVAIAARGVSLRLVRTSIELTVLITGWLLGGSVGVGTLAYALLIGPITHVTIPAFRLSKRGT
ncbi:MAG TPA: hypothetical protein VGG17_09335 [Acidimicrobiales bacterium]